MAGMDKMYAHSYYEYDDLRRWAIAYYPELLFYFYDVIMTYQQWKNNCDAYIKRNVNIAVRDYEKLGSFNNEAEAVVNLIEYYKEHDYECSVEQAREEVAYMLKAYKRREEDWEMLYEFPITNTPLEVDRKLKWICPIPFVRKYLETHCGIKTKWYHKLFWKGKKYFL